MTLDHVRGFFTPEGANPTDLETTTPAFFAVRWITHLCAPGFVLLMGISAALRAERDPAGTPRFLVERGLWLIVLEATWVSFSWSWDPTRPHFGVLWALGGSMLALAIAARLPRRLCLALGLTIPVVLAALPGAELAGMLSPGALDFGIVHIWTSYPLLPWIAVALTGWGLAPTLVHAPPRRLVRWGAAAAVLGLGLRLGGIGDPRAWSVGADSSTTALAVLHMTKYPPSLDYLLVTLGIDVALMGALVALRGRLGDWLVGLGRVPMFFYLLHIPLAHALGNALSMMIYGTARIPPTEPLRLWLVFLATGVVLAILTPACRAWAGLKERRRDLRWLRFF